MKEKGLPDNLEDAIILSFLYAEYFIQKICVEYTMVYLNLVGGILIVK